MEALRDLDAASYVSTLQVEELEDGSFVWKARKEPVADDQPKDDAEEDAEIDEIEPWQWKEVADYLITLAQSKDPTGHFCVVENLNKAAYLIGYEVIKCYSRPAKPQAPSRVVPGPSVSQGGLHAAMV